MPTKFDNEILEAAIEGFEAQKKRLDAQIAEIRLRMTGGNATPAVATPATGGKRRTVSAAGRKRMAEAQRKRWAAKKQTGAASEATAPEKPKRKMSAAGRANIIAATKKRWALARAAAAKAAK